MTDARIEVVYRARVSADEAHELAVRIAYEQTVELPVGQVDDPHVLAAVVGRVESVRPDPGSAAHHHLTISHAAAMANGQLSQLLNLIYGNVSIYPGIRLTNLALPPELLSKFCGPNYGIEGLRRMLGVWGRPLLASAIKPRGLEASELAKLAHGFALGGGDLIKDDQNLVDDFDGFKHRVDAVARGVAQANERTGRNCLYLPHLCGPFEDLPRYLDYVEALGLAGVLICPLVVGLDAARALVTERGLVFMAHPAMTGTLTNSTEAGVDHAVLLSTLFRLAGADISIFPNWGGRFSLAPETCLRIADSLSEQLGQLRGAWPCPAGGMTLKRVQDMHEHYGTDVMLLIGGALLGARGGLETGTRQFLDAIRSHATERLSEPERRPILQPSVHVLRALGDFNWSGRESAPYKDAGDLAFKGVRRVELAGRFGERTAYDLRYFEVAPGGYSSHEKHVHAHVVIGARGVGRLRLGEVEVTLKRDDVAYIEPLQAHQLCNDSEAPFGFYCIVDHHRDRPMKA